MKKWMTYAQGFICAAALFLAVHSAGIMCMGKFYQPVAPKSLDQYKKF